MIDERMEEQASLHVLGALSEAEAREFKQAMSHSPELREFVARLSTATGALAGTAPAKEPPPQLRAKILAQIEPRQKIVALPERKTGASPWLPWLLAACLAFLCAILFVQDNRLRETAEDQAQQIGSLNRLAVALQSATNHLQQAVVALQETNRLADLHVAMLGSLLADTPKAVAVSLWDNETQAGVLVAQNLKLLPADKDYELWIIDENQQPVAAGVFHIDGSGAMRMNIKPIHSIKTANKFAVTEEVKGGVASPTLKDMVLVSN